jgi:hypothetical protein
MCGLVWTKFLVVFQKEKEKLSHVLETPILFTKKKIGILFHALTTYKCMEIHWVLSIVMTSFALLAMKATTCVFCNLQQDNVHDLCHALNKVITLMFLD